MIEIAGRKIGTEYPPLVIAEIGINHEGNLEVAKEMVDAAFRAGVEIVKHQTHIVEDEMSGAAKKVIPGNGSAIFIHLTKNYKPTAGCIALSKKDFLVLIKLINKNTKIRILK